MKKLCFKKTFTADKAREVLKRCMETGRRAEKRMYFCGKCEGYHLTSKQIDPSKQKELSWRQIRKKSNKEKI